MIRLLALLICAICCAARSAPLPQEGSTAARRLLRAFDSKHTRNNYPQRLAAIQKLHGSSNESEALALVEAYRRLDAEALPTGKEEGRAVDEATSHELVRFRKSLDPIDTLQDEVAAALRSLDASLADTMLRELVAEARKPDPCLSLQVLLADKAKGFRDIDLLRHQLERPLEPGSLCALVRVVETLGRRGSGFSPAREKLLTAGSAPLRPEVARPLGQTGGRPTIPLLIDRLKVERGRVKEVVAVALATLTGQNHGLSAEAWTLWWKDLETKDDFMPEAGSVPPPPKLPDMGEYFGIAQDGSSILYIFDRSDSMERGLAKGGSREERARKELAAALDKLDEATRFNIVVFSIKVRSWAKGYRDASRRNVADAKRWLFDLDMQAGTSTYDALQRGFRLSGSRSIDRFDELDVETVFFLSDGEPTRRTGGTLNPLVRDDPQRILSAVRRYDPLGRVKIHTIGLALATKDAPILMRGLAEEHGGRFVAIR